jgi:hypothetical protein
MCLLLMVSWCFAAHRTYAAVVGDQVELKATQRSGVPFHHAPGSTHSFQRVPSGTVATVVGLDRAGNWLQLRLADHRTGWIVARYVGRTLTASPPPGPLTDAERHVWTSPEACQQVVTSGGRMAPANPAILRAGTWNIRWFPRGCPSNRMCPDKTTDLP